MLLELEMWFYAEVPLIVFIIWRYQVARNVDHRKLEDLPGS